MMNYALRVNLTIAIVAMVPTVVHHPVVNATISNLTDTVSPPAALVNVTVSDTD